MNHMASVAADRVYQVMMYCICSFLMLTFFWCIENMGNRTRVTRVENVSTTQVDRRDVLNKIVEDQQKHKIDSWISTRARAHAHAENMKIHRGVGDASK